MVQFDLQVDQEPNQLCAFNDEDKKDVANKIDTILKRVEEEPKTRNWKLRARIGAKRKWYTDVDALTE
jgi:hypothetical protein